MDAATGLVLRLAGAAGIAAALTLFFWNWDRRLSAGVVHAPARQLQAGQTPGRAETDALSAELLRSSIGPRPVAGLALHILRTSALSLVLLAIVFFMTLPGHVADFLGTWESLWRFLLILLLNGLSTVFLVGYAGAAAMAPLAPRIAAATPVGALLFILLDLAARSVALVIVTGAEYVLFAELGGSFGGSWRTALGVIPETLAVALRGESLAGVPVYAALLGGFPLLLVLLAKLSGRHAVFPAAWRRLARIVPLHDRPVRYLGILLAAMAAAAALVASLALQSGASAAGP